jgi:hypothetical protein
VVIKVREQHYRHVSCVVDTALAALCVCHAINRCPIHSSLSLVLGQTQLKATCLLCTYIWLQDIFRRYPNQYESIIATLCDSLDSLDEPEAKVRVRGGGSESKTLDPCIAG